MPSETEDYVDTGQDIGSSTSSVGSFDISSESVAASRSESRDENGEFEGLRHSDGDLVLFRHINGL